MNLHHNLSEYKVVLEWHRMHNCKSLSRDLNNSIPDGVSLTTEYLIYLCMTYDSTVRKHQFKAWETKLEEVLFVMTQRAPVRAHKVTL